MQPTLRLFKANQRLRDGDFSFNASRGL